MLTIDELRGVVILDRLSDIMLERLLPLVQQIRFNEDDTIFKEHDTAETFYMLKSGKVFLEQRISDNMGVCIDAIKPGYAFGWSALLGGGIEPHSHYTSDAICVEPSEVYSVNSDDIHDLMDNDHAMGYLLTRRLNQVIFQRLMHRKEQLVSSIKQGPDIVKLIAV